MLRGVTRAIAVVALLGGTLATATGCVTFGACPAIGWTHSTESCGGPATAEQIAVEP